MTVVSDHDSLNKAQHCGAWRLKGCSIPLKSKAFADSHRQEIRSRVSDALRIDDWAISIIPALALIGFAPIEGRLAAGANCQA